MRTVRRLMGALVVVLLAVLVMPCVARAAGSDAGEGKTVRVGISEYPVYAYYDSDGNPTGADVEYAYRIAQYEDLDIEVVLIPDAESYFAALDNGTVDMLFDVVKTDERAQRYLFAEYQTGSTPNSIYVRSDDTRFEYGNVDELRDKVFGSEKDSYVTTSFVEWCRGKGFEPQVREYADASAINAALDAGEVDAGVCGDRSVEGYVTVQEFSPTPYYSIFRLDEGDLKTKVDDAMSRILSAEPLYGERLLDKYSGVSSAGMDVLSGAEAAYVAKHPTVTVAAIENDAPYYWIDSDGKERGVLVDYCARLAKLTGLTLEIKAFSSQADAIAAVKSGDVDMVGIYSNGLVAARRQGLALTDAYASEDVVEVIRSGMSVADVKRIAVKLRSKKGFEDTLGLEGVEYVGYENANACFDALRAGEVDAIISGSPSATYLINQTNSSAYSILPMSSQKMEMCGALRPDDDVLCSLMNKAIAVSTSDFDTYVSTNTMTENNTRTMVSRLDPTTIIAVGVALSVLVVGLVAALVMLWRRQREAAQVAAAKAENDQRQATLAAAERANEERNDFFSAISHDMRTPLNAIIGFSTLARDKVVSPEVADYLTKIQTSGNVLLGLIDDTLTVSKVSSGKLTICTAPVDSAELLDSVVVTIGEFATQHRETFEFVDRTSCHMIMADKVNVQKVILNLLTNAVKYTLPGGHVTLTVESHNAEKGGCDSVIVVADDGIGMAKEFLPHIYEPFVQERNTGGSSGTGLGLSIVKQLVDLMGGTIDVESEKGVGTTFTVRLHFDDVPEELLATGAEASGDDATGELPAADLTGRRVLLCEDNELNAEIASAFLMGDGLKVDRARNGQEGLTRFAGSEQGRYAAILMDVRMPLMDGVATTRAIRALDREDARTVPIIAMTADAFPDDVRKCLDAGMNEHIAKPLDPDRVRDVLRREIGVAEGGGDASGLEDVSPRGDARD